MQPFTVHTVAYLPGAESVTIVARAASGPFAGKLFDLHTTQAALAARAPDGVPWSDAEVYGEAAVLLDRLGGVLA